ncbi:MAG: hypothetical protein A2V88_17880 [Elusimicrobia bacterium RBG_16_66_12]|nr:MAG: hypothetical protein A2V88_17880 [Elusimicrobia bacterium RBG_16_66_12]
MAAKGEYDRLRNRLMATDPLLVEAADEVDAALLRWALALSPWERLRASAQALAFLSSFRRATSAAD